MAQAPIKKTIKNRIMIIKTVIVRDRLFIYGDFTKWDR